MTSINFFNQFIIDNIFNNFLFQPYESVPYFNPAQDGPFQTDSLLGKDQQKLRLS